MKHPQALFSTFAAISIAFPAAAEVKLPQIFGSHMVLQRDAALHIWGTAEAGEKVSVQIAGRKANTMAGDDGSWSVDLPSMKPDGRTHKLTVKGKNEIVLENILVGDVWIGSGQSNMEWQLRSTEKSNEFIAAADHPRIRLFHIPKKTTKEPANDVNAAWKPCTPANIPTFSAALYHFGRIIEADQNIPIGLINSSWGGSPIEPWIVTATGSGEMYNGMIAPITDFPVTGSIWYQGETNVINKNGLAYTGKMKDLIEGWRSVFDNKGMPFYFVQIAPWDNGSYAAGQLPALWEAQTATLKLPNTGMAVITDIVHNLKDIHPQNKHDVGDRLARWALAKHYKKKNVVSSGPIYKAMRVEKNRIRIAFAHLGGGLRTRDGGELNEFTIAGADGNFVDAQAKIDGKFVVVQSDEVPSPTQVRFGWHRVAQPNLINAAGLPASPFQTKNWTGGTGE